MAFLYISDVYACIHKTLREDEVIRKLMGFDESTTSTDMALRIQKRKNPVELVDGKLPLITFYKLPGQRELTNYLSYVTAFDFDIYTNDDVELAIEIADRINYLFDDKYLPLSKGSSFKGHFVTSAEDETDLENTYKYFTQVEFTFGIEG
ncbi:hypothetical protein [Bacillus subtilis]|uniref:hypothetical protein n=1 Tax=Bacillus subtilis TaxID=1423 RepID=UPI000A103EB1|nr:hypothetical protein [Bacillus subtilis]MEC2266488.1 hypothetical protein [Bacillus subtilis]MEC4031947.1 hypothetical protein [Bacillus subtilis]